MPEPLVYDFFNKIIEVPAPDTTLSLQYLVDQTRDVEDEITPSPGMVFSKIIDAYGKQSLGGGSLVGITVVMLDGWRVRFESRAPGPDTVACTISGGNFVGNSGANPVAPSPYVAVTIAQSSSATITTPASDTTLLYLIESLAGRHRSVGSYFYWDPEAGLDTNAGTSPSTAVKTFTAAYDLVVSGRNDTIFCLATDNSGITTVDDTLLIEKNNLKLRGPGHIFQIIPTDATGANTITINANNVEINGIYVSTKASGTWDGIVINGNGNVIQDCWLSTIRGDGIDISSSARSRIDTCVIEKCGESGTGDGIKIGNTTTQSVVSKCIVSDNVNGVSLAGTGIADNIFENNLIYNNSAYGITIGSGVTRTGVRGGNTFAKNTSGSTFDDPGAINTFIESTGAVTDQNITDIVDAVWNEVITASVHAGAESAGKTLRDAKTRATLASLK